MKLCTQHIVSIIQLKVLLTITFVLSAILTYSQQNSCSDSSFRIRYIFGSEGAILFQTPDTTGKNYFTGEFREGNIRGMAVLKTTWGDSMVWARKIYMNGSSWNSYLAPGGTIVCTGEYGGAVNNKPELLLCRIDTNGIVKWIYRYRLQQNHQYYSSGNSNTKNLIITSNAIYVIAPYYDASFNKYNIVAKIDLDGNILWSKAFTNAYNGFSGTQSPTFANNKLYFLSGSYQTGNIIITSLNDADGGINESFRYNIVPDQSVKAIIPDEIRINKDNTISLIGLMGVDLTGSIAPSDIFFNVLMDASLNPVQNYYYKNNVYLNVQELFYNLNNFKQKSILITNSSNFLEKYFLTFDKNNDVQRSRKFVLPSNFGTIFRNSLKLDDKQNIHYVYQYRQANKYVNEYARISNFAPTGTLGCFGKDTSILTRYPFTLTKEPFVWNNIQSDVIVRNNVTYTEDTAIVTKELVCKIVSRCDSVHINGPAAACVGVPVRYTVSKNSGCLKNLDWSIDTAFANIVNLEGDSAITINFKKTFNGYIHAALTDCVVKDSFLVKAVVPVMPPLIKRTDSLLCPGKTLTLSANNGYSNYVWQGNTAGQQFTVNAVGVYTVTAADSCGITQTDSIRVILSDTSLTIPPTQTICLYDTAFITLPADVNNITWQPTTNSFLNNKTLLFYPPQTTLYTITAERTPNCSILKTTTVVIKTCPQTVFIPNAFTPQKNGLNDIFKPPISQPLALYRLQIFNRYGQTIFESNNQQSGWDGTYKGKQQPMGGYIYQCSYKFNGGVQKMVKGYFILIR